MLSRYTHYLSKVWYVFIPLALAVAVTAIGEAFDLADMPFALLSLLYRLPIWFRVHMVSGGLAFIFIIAALLMRRRRPVHRFVGRLAAISVIASGISAFPVAILSDSIPMARAGLFVQAIVWLVFLGIGLKAIWKRDIATHRFSMCCMAAVTSGAMFLRLALYIVSLCGESTLDWYATVAWAGWIVPLGITFFVLRPTKKMATG